MGFMDYSNQTQSNVIPKEEFEALVHETFKIIAENVSKSLGPLGSSATILDGSLTEATKDGHAIMKKLCFHNRYRKMIYNLIFRPCVNMNNTVGDGTTTVICLASALFDQYREMQDRLKALYRLPRDFNKTWDECIRTLCEKVEEAAKPVDPKDYQSIRNLAYVSSNGNDEISDAMASVYQEVDTPAIRKKDSPTNRSYIVPINGYDFPAHMIDSIWVRNEDGTVEETDLSILIFDFKIDTDLFNEIIRPINDVMRAMNKKLLVLAPFYDRLMCDTILDQYIRYEFQSFGKANLILGQYTLGKLAPHQLNDFATIVRGRVITEEIANSLKGEINQSNIDSVVEKILMDDQYVFRKLIGTCHEVLLTIGNGSVFKPASIEEDKDYKRALADALRELGDAKAEVSSERQSYAHKVYEANTRVQQLQMKNYIYYVGADSELQKQILQDAIDDVIKCLRSATRYGVVPGCQLTVAKAAVGLASSIDRDTASDHEILVSMIYEMIANATLNVYTRVLDGPERMGICMLLPRWNCTTEDGIEALQKERNEKLKQIMEETMRRGEVFDMETLEFNPGIITSAETDIMALRSASELVKILISGNLCIFCDADVDESHQEDHQVYV